VGVITNHRWLENPTFKGMRKSLLSTFDQIYVIDLHGNSRSKERLADGTKDENVFDIEQGVAISLFVRAPRLEKAVYRSDVWGRRIKKYQEIATATKETMNWTRVHPGPPDWLFKLEDLEVGTEYRKFFSIPEILGRLGDPAPGIVTTHDQFAVSFTPKEARKKVRALMATESEAEARRSWKLCSQNQWNYERAKNELKQIDIFEATMPILYQPFDNRWTIWDRNVVVHRRERVTKHMRSAHNIAVNVIRKMDISGVWSHILVSELPINHHAVSSKEVNFTFPLWIDELDTGRAENFTPKFRLFVDSQYDRHYTPEEILGYIYAVLHSPAYRARYAEFLRKDFPRVPFPESADAFEALSGLGWALVQAHLLREVPRRGLADYRGRGDHRVEAVRYAPAEQAVHINKTQSFAPMPQDVWEFRIGGYQVLDKYLKSRKGRALSLDETGHIAAVADALAFTIEQMARIDQAYRAAFPDQA
jgi:predicted helicase